MICSNDVLTAKTGAQSRDQKGNRVKEYFDCNRSCIDTDWGLNRGSVAFKLYCVICEGRSLSFRYRLVSPLKSPPDPSVVAVRQR